jgi:hypothetical protein
VAFAIGSFPLILWQLVVGVTRRLPGVVVALPSLKSNLPLSDLDGLSVWHEARLEEEDIENIPNMAASDIVDLILNTRFPPHRIIDWVDQAILYTALGSAENIKNKDRREAFRENGIRTASSLMLLRSKLENEGQDAAAVTLTLPDELKNAVRVLGTSLVTNANLRLVQTWKALPT